MDIDPFLFLTEDVSGGAEDNCMSFVVSKCTSCPDDTSRFAEIKKLAESCPGQRDQASVLIDDWWEDVVIKNDVNYAATKNALEITEQFIADNNLILIGGMAIDMALKLVGRPGIYLSEKLPDYDFLSDDTVRDSAKLAHILCKAHLINVSAINAMHTTTIKVRCNFTPAADIGYCPPSIYKDLPTIKIGKVRIIHPHFQIIDIHRSLSYPFDRAQVIGAGLFYRWKKDCTRYDLLLDAYPIKCETSVCTVNTSRVMIDKELISGDCLAGWAALSIWKETINSGARDVSADSLNILSVPADIELPEGQSIQIFTDDFNKYISRADSVGNESVRYFEAILGHVPRHVKVIINNQEYEVFDNYGALLSAEKSDNGEFYVANLQHCMLFLLENIYMAARGCSDDVKAYCRAQYTKCTELFTSPNVKPGILPSINVYGSANLDESFLVQRRKFVARLSGNRLKEKDVIDGIYPVEPKCTSNIEFNYENSPYFAISGKQCKPFIKREIPSIG